MFGKFVFALMTAASLVACAQPNYAPAESASGTQDNKAVEACPYKLSKSAHCVSLKWEQVPKGKNYGSFTFSIFDIAADGSYAPVVVNQELNVLLWMPDMGHGSSPVQVSPLEAGSYRVSNVYFVMPGDWEIRIQLMDGSKVTDEVVIPYTY